MKTDINLCSKDEDNVFLVECKKVNEQKSWRQLIKYSKISLLVLTWVVCSCVIMAKNEKIQNVRQLSVAPVAIKDYYIHEKITDEGTIWISLQGGLLPSYYANLSTKWLNVWVERVVIDERPRELTNRIKLSSIMNSQNVSEVWKVPLVSEKLIGSVPEVNRKKLFKLNTTQWQDDFFWVLARIRFSTNMKTNLPLSLEYNIQPINYSDGVIYAALVLIGLYVLIISEIVHRTLAAVLCSTIAVAILAALDARPTMEEILSWISVDTLLLLFSMMIIVTLLGETGVFDYMSVLAYKVTKGKVWPLMVILWTFTALVSCCLDNVTTVLLITPVTIRLCEVLKINPVTVLTSTVMFSNLGGAVTPIGDPPNVIIQSNPSVIKAGVNFGTFTLHMGIGVFIVSLVLYVQFRIMYRTRESLSSNEPEFLREVAVWKRTAASMSSYSKEEEIVKDSLMKTAKKLMETGKSKYESTLQDLETQYPLRDKALLIKSCSVLLIIIAVFFINSIPGMSCLGLGWTALLGAFLLLLLTDRDDIDAILSRVEWSTLFFFASLFVLMEALAKLGLIDWIGKQTHRIIMSVDQENRLTIAILLILWISAAASAFVDNIPLTTVMIRVATSLIDNQELELPLQPLIWALSFGACLGGNGSLFGSSSNIVCAGVAEQHGYKFTFMQFFRIGLPVLISSMTVITMYLLVCHVVFAWH